MAVTTISNKSGKSATIHISSANASIIVAGNPAVSNIASTGETVVSGYIRQVAWGTDAGSIQIRRAGNLVATFVNSGLTNFAGQGLPLTGISPTANIDVQFVGSANGYVIIEIQKTF